MLTIKHQQIVPLKAVPVSEFVFEEFITLEDEKALMSVTDFFPRKNTNDPFISNSYSVLEDLNLVGLITKFNESVDYYSREILQCPLQFKMVGSWLTKNVKGTQHFSHKHPNCYISVVSYFGDFDNNDSAGIKFVELGLEDVFSEKNINFYNEKIIKSIKWNIFNNQTYTIKSKKNQVIIFPGHLRHESEVCQSEGRFCVGVNYYITGILGDVDNKDFIVF